MDPDVVIVGAGPAGAIAGLVAARAGARVRILDRAVFPRDKLCGDTINPGALAQLVRLGVAGDVDAHGLPVAGMIVTGENGARILGRYPGTLRGRAILRRELDATLLRAAIGAGCEFEEGVAVHEAVLDHHRGTSRVAGVVAATRGGRRVLNAPVVIAADGRRSRLAFGLGLTRHPRAPRRWAIGAYYVGVRPDAQSRAPAAPAGQGRGSGTVASTEAAVLGEMHVRRNFYAGVAPLPADLTNLCVVRSAGSSDAAFRHPVTILQTTIANDPILRQRLEGGRLAAPPVVLGPLAVDPTGGTIDGLLLAGDAAGFIDPMTGDGLRFAIEGGELAAVAALRALDAGWTGVHASLAGARVRAFTSKWRLNRTLRALVGSPRAVTAAALAARLAPAALRAVIARAGDCDLAA
jgi:flavin-dependent dehydrogenase